VFLCTPNNPTGRLLPREIADGAIEYCKKNGARLFLDECFLDLAGGASLKSRLSEYPGLFILRAFTKTFGMAGLRLGYGLCSDKALLSRMAELTPPWDVSSAAQAAGVAAIGESSFADRARELVEAERPKLKLGLEALGLYVCPSEANYLLFFGPEDLGAALLSRGILLRDCANFHGLGPGWYRTAVRTASESGRLITAVREVLWQRT